MKVTVAHAIANLLFAISHAPERNTEVWTARNRARLDSIIKEHMPSGSGFDNGTTLAENSTPDKLVFHTDFHHMNEGGFYTHWSQYDVTAKASFLYGIALLIGGRDSNQVKDHIYEVFKTALEQEIEL